MKYVYIVTYGDDYEYKDVDASWASAEEAIECAKTFLSLSGIRNVQVSKVNLDNEEASWEEVFYEEEEEEEEPCFDCDRADLEMGFNPYMGGYDYDCY